MLESDSADSADKDEKDVVEPVVFVLVGAVGGAEDEAAVDERAAAPELAAVLSVQRNGGHPRPVAAPGHVAADDALVRRRAARRAR